MYSTVAFLYYGPWRSEYTATRARLFFRFSASAVASVVLLCLELLAFTVKQSRFSWCAVKTHRNISPWCVHIKWMWPITDVVESVGWLCGPKEKKKEGPASHYERDIVPHRPYSSFVDKWIFMLIKWDTDMSENCGECGIILTIRSYTRITVVLSVCGLTLSFPGAAFNPKPDNPHHKSYKYVFCRKRLN